MKIEMQAGASISELSFSRWDHAIVGEAVDPRGEAAIDFATRSADAVHRFHYDPKRLAIEFDGASYSAEEPERSFAGITGASVLLEATTLGFVEILLCCRALKQTGQASVSLVYAEPLRYFQPRRSQIVHRRDFELSDEVEEFTAVPGNAILLLPERPIKAVVFLGFEGQRLNRFLEQTGVSPSKCDYVLGVPAYRPGWEMNAFANNLRVLSGGQMAGHLQFCGANSPASAYEMLCRVHASCDGERFFITPIGTKPHGIGAALFLCDRSDVGVVYDNPKRKDKRSDELGTWHLFEALF